MMDETDALSIDKFIRKIPDFPKKGILYYDITGILIQPEAFRWCIARMVELYKDKKVDAVAGIESRGFLFAAPFAQQMEIPLLIIRKAGKLPGITLKRSYSLEYGKAEIETHSEDIPYDSNILIVDDLLASGGTMKAASEILASGRAHVTNAFGVIGLPSLGYEERLAPIQCATLIKYE